MDNNKCKKIDDKVRVSNLSIADIIEANGINKIRPELLVNKERMSKLQIFNT
jgi:hypothetical protein